MKIEEFVVEVIVDPKEAKKGGAESVEALDDVGEAADKTKIKVDGAGRKMGESIGKLRNELLSLFAAFTAGTGLKQFFTQITNADAATGRTAKNIGTSVENLSIWQGVAERAGGSAEGITNSLQGLSQSFQELALTGQSAVIPYFRSVGVTLADANGHLRPFNDILDEVADKFKGMDPAKAQALGRGMGFDEGTVNVLIKGSAALRALRAEQEKLGYTNEADKNAATERQAAIRGLGQASVDAGRKILTVLTPAILWLTKELTKLGEWFKDHPKIATAAVTTLTGAVVVLTTAMAVGAVAAFGSMTVAGVAAFGTLLASAMPLVAAIATITAAWSVGTGISNLLDKAASSSAGHDATFGGMIYDWTHADKSEIKAAASGGASNSKLPRGIRNNNPGNLNFVGQSGARKEAGANGRFAVFASMEEGIVALANQLQRYAAAGIDSVEAIISKYAPAGENNAKAYIQALSKRLGVGTGQKLNLNNSDTMQSLIEGISDIENGRGHVSKELINSALNGRAARAGANTGNSVKSEVHIGELNVNTQATDAKGIARDIGGQLTQELRIAAQANYGLS